ncbi:MAG: hypothetical protein RJB38_588 [Pseudomonadota bacterium]|jgi:hypothetical protein
MEGSHLNKLWYSGDGTLLELDSEVLPRVWVDSEGRVRFSGPSSASPSQSEASTTAPPSGSDLDDLLAKSQAALDAMLAEGPAALPSAAAASPAAAAPQKAPDLQGQAKQGDVEQDRNARFYPPEETVWYLVTITLLSQDRVEVAVRAQGTVQSKKMIFSLNAAGLEDRRTAGRTNRRFKVLQKLAEEKPFSLDSIIFFDHERRSPADRHSIKAAVKDLRRWIEKFIPGVPGDPFQEYDEFKCYRPKFKVLDQSAGVVNMLTDVETRDPRSVRSSAPSPSDVSRMSLQELCDTASDEPGLEEQAQDGDASEDGESNDSGDSIGYSDLFDDPDQIANEEDEDSED